MTLSNCCPKTDLVDTLPLKRGPRGSLSLAFLQVLDAHISMCQLSGNGEVKMKKLKALIRAAINNTKLKDKVSVDYVFKKLKEMFPNTIQESKAIKVKDQRMNWTTYINLNLWFEGTKKELIHYGYVVDNPQVVSDIFDGHPMPFDIPSESIFYIFVLFLILCLSLFSFHITFRGYYC